MWKISQKQILSDVLNFLEIGPARYSNRLTDNGCFIGKCKLDIGNSNCSRQTGGTNILGEEMKNPYGAECSAATMAVKY